MTIAAYISQLDNRVYMASDSFSLNGTHKQHIKETRILKLPEDIPCMLLGFSGSPLVVQAIKTGIVFPPKNSELKSILLFVLDNIIPNLQKVNDNFEILMAFDHKIFHISSSFVITEIKGNYNAIGTGRDYVIGSLYALENSNIISPIDKLTIAIESAIKYDVGSGGDINIEYI